MVKIRLYYSQNILPYAKDSTVAWPFCCVLPTTGSLIHPQSLTDKGETVRFLLDPHPAGLAGAVAAPGLDADYDWIGAALGLLQFGAELEAVPGGDPVIMVTGLDQGRRITGTGRHVVQG